MAGEIVESINVDRVPKLRVVGDLAVNHRAVSDILSNLFGLDAARGAPEFVNGGGFPFCVEKECCRLEPRKHRVETFSGPGLLDHDVDRSPQWSQVWVVQRYFG